jgi:hypothetical protein
MRLGVLPLVVSGAYLSAAPAWADRPQEREGFWIGFGVGYGSAKIGCDGCGSNDREGSMTGFLKLGGTLSGHVLLGTEINIWTKDMDGLVVARGNGSVTATVYPRTTGGFFVKGGVGASFAESTFRGDSTTISESGFGLLVGAGYDLRVDRRISITPVVNYYYGTPGDMIVRGELVAGGLRHNIFDFGVGLTFH